MTDGLREEAAEKVKKWTLAGYNVSVLSDFLADGNDEELEELLEDYTARIVRLKRAEKTVKREDIVLLSSMDTGVYNTVRDINKLMKDPEKVAEVEIAVSRLLKQVGERQIGSRMRGLIDGITEEIADDVGRAEKVSEIFVVYNDGRLLYHMSLLKGRKGIDTDILSGMLTAVQDFVRHCLQYDSGSFKKLEYGQLKIVVESGKYIYVAYITSGAIDKDTGKRLRGVVDRIESRFEDVLAFWDGDINSIRGIGRIVKDSVQGDH